jgi:hypothetical protein
MAGGRGVVGDEYALLGEALDALLAGEGRDAPGEVVDVLLEESPVAAEVLRRVELLVDLAGLVAELLAVRPGGRQRPGLLQGVESELVNLLARVEASDGRTTVLSQPVDPVGPCTWVSSY